MLSHVISVIFAANVQPHIQFLGNVVMKELNSATELRVQTPLQSYVHHATQREGEHQTQLDCLQVYDWYAANCNLLSCVRCPESGMLSSQV